jgi:murein DD-endopeptidase MepM/ murein hydrolase activator NlpD
MIDFDAFDFHPVIHLPDDVPVFDFTTGYDPDALRAQPWGIGRYDEPRVAAMYDAPHYEAGRSIHMGVDVWAPADTPVHAAYDGAIAAVANHDRPRDYGPTIITQHDLGGTSLWILHGHLSRDSLTLWSPGDAVARGRVLATVGKASENGGWVPHLHVQLSFRPPEDGDLPGVVTPDQRAAARRQFPDPRHVLGMVYDEPPLRAP